MTVASAVDLAGAAAPGMHVPDGFMSAPVAVAGWVATVAVVTAAVRLAERQLSDRAVPLMGVMAAFIFAAQMMNFPVAGGTSGHLLGGALAAILLGPWAAVIVMTAVIGLQAFLFQDGGIAALGLNILNMGIVTVFVGLAVYRPLAVLGTRVRPVAAFIAAWCSVEVAAGATALQLAISGASPLEVALPAMLGVHALIGIGEGLITASTVGFLSTARPDLLRAAHGGRT